MDHDDVFEGEMHLFRSQPDPIDAVVGDEVLDEDFTDIAAIVHELRAAYMPVEPLAPSSALSAFTEVPVGDLLVAAGSKAHGSTHQMAGLPNPKEPRRKKMLSAVGAFVTTLTGKVMLTTAVAAASVGGLHAADVVDLPLLPDKAIEAPLEETPTADEVRQDGETPDQAEAGKATAEASKAAAAEYSEAVREWTDCVAANAGPRGDDEEGCKDRPSPTDFALTELPDQASDGQANKPETPASDGAPGELPYRAGDGQANKPETPAGDRAPRELPGPATDGQPDVP
jgi:hypothetical protein